ncbi:MAG: hypothetical protein JRI68_03930 [Deltaproteobacteria bacterium]|nr:hypothetical protein [Deltaproteobacteria bacterium]
MTNPTMIWRGLPILALGIAFAGCHLALGIEDAETLAGGGGNGGTAGTTSGCTGDAQCDDDDYCTADTCVEGSCDNAPVPDGDAPAEEQTTADCQVVRCIGGVRQNLADDTDLPTDGQECTADLCSEGTPSNPPLPAETACSQDGGILCDDDGDCVECYSNAHCDDPETCGGGGTPGACGCTPISCGPSGANLTCGYGADNGCGAALNCNNNSQDGTETDVDCGGSVSTCSVRCNVGQSCLVPSDCASGICGTNNTCESS